MREPFVKMTLGNISNGNGDSDCLENGHLKSACNSAPVMMPIVDLIDSSDDTDEEIDVVDVSDEDNKLPCKYVHLKNGDYSYCKYHNGTLTGALHFMTGSTECNNQENGDCPFVNCEDCKSNVNDSAFTLPEDSANNNFSKVENGYSDESSSSLDDSTNHSLPNRSCNVLTGESSLELQIKPCTVVLKDIFLSSRSHNWCTNEKLIKPCSIYLTDIKKESHVYSKYQCDFSCPPVKRTVLRKRKSIGNETARTSSTSYVKYKPSIYFFIPVENEEIFKRYSNQLTCNECDPVRPHRSEYGYKTHMLKWHGIEI